MIEDPFFSEQQDLFAQMLREGIKTEQEAV